MLQERKNRIMKRRAELLDERLTDVSLNIHLKDYQPDGMFNREPMRRNFILTGGDVELYDAVMEDVPILKVTKVHEKSHRNHLNQALFNAAMEGIITDMDATDIIFPFDVAAKKRQEYDAKKNRRKVK